MGATVGVQLAVPPAASERKAALGRCMSTRDWLVVTGVTVSTWPIGSASPIGGDDPFRFGLAMGLVQRMAFGRDLVFTYGPLGALSDPRLYFASTGLTAAVFTIAVHTFVILGLWFAVRRSLRTLPAVAIVYVLAHAVRLIEPAEALVVVVLYGCVAAIRKLWRVRPVVVGGLGGMIAGFGLLLKFNIGIEIVGMVMLTVLSIGKPKVRALAVLLGSLVVTVVVLWIVAGQSLKELPGYVSNSFEIASGYSVGMVYDFAPKTDGPEALLLAAGVAFLFVNLTREWPRNCRWLFGLLWLWFAWLSMKHGFVRHGRDHAVMFFAIALVAPLSLWRTGRDRAGLAYLGVASLFFLHAIGISDARSLVRFLNPIDRVVRAAEVVPKYALHAREESRTARAAWREHLNLAEAIPIVNGGTVDVWPTDTSVMWAHPEWPWHPRPIFQNYAAYTTRLDELNARSLAHRGPDFILRSAPNHGGLDDRAAVWDTPETVFAMLCHYRHLAIPGDGTWEILARVKNRCGALEPMGTKTIRFGQVIEVPEEKRSGRLVVARFEPLENSVSSRLRAVIWRSPQYKAIVNWFSVYDFIPGTSSGTHLMFVPASVDYPGAFRLSIRARTLGFSSGRGAQDRIKATFFSVPFRP